MLLDQCPHCGTRNVDCEDKTGSGHADGTVWQIVCCRNPKCNKFVFLHRRDNNNLFQYPIGKLDVPNDPAVPSEVVMELRESMTCLYVGCYLASMTMSRRVLQRCLKQQGFTQKTLAQQIDAAKADGTIPKRYHALADEIREYGNIGAHPDDDNAALVTADNAKHLLGFVEILIHEFYELPAKAAALSKQRK